MPLERFYAKTVDDQESLNKNDTGHKMHGQLVKLSEAFKVTPDILTAEIMKSEGYPDILQCSKLNGGYTYDSSFKIKLGKFGDNSNFHVNGFNKCIHYRDKKQIRANEYSREKTISTNTQEDLKQKNECKLGLSFCEFDQLTKQNKEIENVAKINILSFKVVPDAELSGCMELCKTAPWHKFFDKDIINKSSSKMEKKLINTIVSNSKSKIVCEIEQEKKHLEQKKSLSLCSLLEKSPKNVNQVTTKIYKKSSFDDRQLPIVGIDYKKPTTKKRKLNKFLRTKNQIDAQEKLLNFACSNKTRDLEEIYQYRNVLSSNKELIVKRSKYSKMSFWGKYLKNTTLNINADDLIKSKRKSKLLEADIQSAEEMSPIHDLKTKTNLRFEFDKIRMSLAFETGSNNFIASNNNTDDWITVPNDKSISLFFINDSSLNDNKRHDCASRSFIQETDIKQHEPIFSSTNNKLPYKKQTDENKNCIDTSTRQQEMCSRDNYKNDFFKNQVRFQSENKTLYIQISDKSNIQSKVVQKYRCSSAITALIRTSLEHIGIQMPYEKRRVSRQILTEINISKLQIIVNDLQSHIEIFNNLLLHYLTIRDDLQMNHDSMLVDIENRHRIMKICSKQTT